jgi:murein DD-endopeptidase MepM/ murein hydrolase activator NlpD
VVLRARAGEARPARIAFNLCLAVIITSLLIGLSIAPALADEVSDKKQQAQAAEQQLNSLQGQLNRLTSELNQTQSHLASLQDSIERNQAQLQAEQAECDRWQAILSQRLVAMYKEGNSAAMEVLLDCEDFDTFINSYDYMARIGNRDAETIATTKDLMLQIKQKRAELDAQKADHQAQLANLANQQQAIQSKLNEQKALLAGLNNDVASLLSTRYQRSAGGSSGGSYGTPINIGPVNGLYFPVAGPHSYTNDWGAPRAVGRTHKGCDVMASWGTPCVAITSGTVEQRSGGNAGNYIALHGDNGHLYYYMHLSKFATSGHVSAGQLIAYVGDTGNARGCPHLHFEWHPGGGGPVNPYPLLCAIDG